MNMETGKRIDVVSVIDGAPLSAFQWRVFALLFIIIMLDGYDTQAIAFVAPAISKAWHLAPSAFGPIFSAGLLGTVIGAVGFGMLADRIGRRMLVIGAVALFGLLTGACAFATGYDELLIYRLGAGVGLGGALVNFLALASEYAPARSRTTIVTISMWGFPLGAVIGGSFAGRMIEYQGWTSIFYLGAVLPLLCVPVLLILLPESVRYMTYVSGKRAAMAHILSKIDGVNTFRAGDDFYLIEPRATRGSVRELFANGLGRGTVLLWITLFASLVLTYCLINWIPSLLRQAGLPIKDAVLGTVMINFAGIVGSLAVSRAMKRRPLRVLTLAYLLGAVSVASISFAEHNVVLIMISIFLTGFFIIGAQLAVTAFITGYYPTSIRGTGVGWSQGVGRFGSLLGPLAGGAVIAVSAQPSHVFLFCAIPALVACAALFGLGRTMHPSSNESAHELQVAPPRH
ncbi:MFS transporter [Paraburkholderia sp. USG1]|uniref:MFS transporter n=1 Tax=Paraburkholderia sp. USG1 TaxID=2952268 RepID=UPI00386218C5